jgi:hypothetical protein
VWGNLSSTSGLFSYSHSLSSIPTLSVDSPNPWFNLKHMASIKEECYCPVCDIIHSVTAKIHMIDLLLGFSADLGRNWPDVVLTMMRIEPRKIKNCISFFVIGFLSLVFGTAELRILFRRCKLTLAHQIAF